MAYRRWYQLLTRRNVWASRSAPFRTSILHLEVLEDRTVPATTLVVSPGGIVSNSFSSIQAAVNAAVAGDTVQVNPGVYIEQVIIPTSLTLQGNGAGTIIVAPPGTLTTTLGFNSIVTISNAATVNINNMTIEGPNSTIDAGIYVAGGATANITGTTVANINQGIGVLGVQTGVGVQVGSSSDPVEVANATITNCTITDYQKSGIITGGLGTNVTITGTTVTGVGPTSLTAQNGVQISAGTTADMSNDTISGNEYNGTSGGDDPTADAQAFGILNLNDGGTFTGNTISGNDAGILSTNTGATATAISGNTLVNNRYEGILLQEGTATVSNNTISDNNIGVAVTSFGGDTVNAVGTLVSNNITNNGNGGLSFAGGGIVLLNVATTTTTAQATAHFNRIVGNAVGLNNQSSGTVDATNNWWGSNAGPGGVGSDSVAGPVTFNPWLVLQATASPTEVAEGGTATVVSNLTMNNAGTDTSAQGTLAAGPMTFATTSGTIVPASIAGDATATFTAGNTPGTATVSSTADNQTVTTMITITSPPPPPPPPPSPPPPPPASTIGAFDPIGEFGQAAATWYLRNSNSPGGANIGPFTYGGANWIPVVGDFNGDGVTTVGVVDPTTMTWYLKTSNSPGSASITPFQYGAPGDIPVVGDWTGDGIDTVGVFDPFARFGHPAATWQLRNSNSAGAADITFAYGAPGWVPVVGDWTGQGFDTVGMFDPIGEFGQPAATWYLRNSNSAGAASITPFTFGAAGWTPVVGDWNGAGKTTVGVVDTTGEFGDAPATWFLRFSNTPGGASVTPFAFGAANWVPLAGDWTDPPPALHVLGGAVLNGPPVNLLTQNTAQAFEAQAVKQLQQAGVSPEVVAQLAAVQVSIGNLGPGELATADSQTDQVVLDPSAAGHGWFVDPTPLQDDAFVAGAAGQPETAIPGGPAASHVDLLTALLQEMGVAAGLDDPILKAALAPSTRNVTALDAYFASL
jgi:parallel beta-helix repeat protein